MTDDEPNFADMGALSAPMLPADDLALSFKDMSDRGNAERFMVRHGDRFLYVRGLGWHVYTGTHWSREGADGRALQAAAATAAAIKDEVNALFEAAKRDANKATALNERAFVLKDWLTTSGGHSRAKGMLAFAAAKLEVGLDAFDRDPLAINVANGTIRFKKRKGVVKSAPDQERYDAILDKHDPKDLITRTSPFEWSAKAPGLAPLWDAHLERCIPDGKERRFLARILGYCAIGLNVEQVFFLMQGRGGDGKSVTINTVRRVLGGYAVNSDVKTFLEDKTGRSAAAASPDLARLAGAVRLVSTSEPPRGSRLNEGLIKLITGGAPLVARHLNKEPIEFTPGFKLMIECNARPAIGGGDDGIWRRVVLMLWRVQLKREEMDPQLEDKLVGQGEGVLAWIVKGVLAYLDLGLSPPASIEAAHADYKRGSNAFREWLDAATEPSADNVELMADLYRSYKETMESLGADERAIMTQKSFGLALSDHQVMITAREPGTRKARRVGVRLLTPAEFERRAALRDAALASGATPIPPPASHEGAETAMDGAETPQDETEWQA